jgi:hypothetical protein
MSRPQSAIPVSEGNSMKIFSRKRRVLGATLGAVLPMLFLTPTAANATTCGAGGCGPYRLDVVYAGGGTASVSYTSQYQWIVDATHAAQRGYRQTSGYTKMTVTDGNYGSAVTATFCASGSPCIGTYSNGVYGQADWQENNYNTDCYPLGSFPGYETPVWAYYLTYVAYDAGGIGGGATIFAAGGNAFGVDCGVV